MSFEIRQTVHPGDFERINQIYNATASQPRILAELLEIENSRPDNYKRLERVALEKSGTVVGYADFSEGPWSKPGQYWGQVRVDPAFYHQGIGNALFEESRQLLKEAHATRVEGMVQEDQPEAVRFLQNRGFKVERHIIESRLDLASFDTGKFAGVVEEARNKGYQFLTFSALDDKINWRLKVYEMIRENVTDIPGYEGLFPSFKEFCVEFYDASWFSPENQLLVFFEDELAGITELRYNIATNSIYNSHTSIARKFRRNRLALPLKLQGIERAMTLEADFISTHNDSKNVPILAVNDKLGYQPQPGIFRVRLEPV